MLALVALALLQPQIDPPRLRTVLPNEATILVEPMRGDTISVQLWASAAGAEDTPETHGLRHLLEHLMIKGPSKDLGRRLERDGAFLRARTFREAMQFEITVPEGRLPLAISAVSELLEPLDATQEEIDREAVVLESEGIFRQPTELLSAAAWQVSYGPEGLDTFGNLDVIRGATPEALQALRHAHFAAPNLVLVITGPVDLDDATKAARPVLSALPESKAWSLRGRGPGVSGRIEAGTFGEARAARVPGYEDIETVSALGAALAIGSQLERCFVTYTPSRNNGLVVLGRTEYDSGLGLFIDGLETARAQSLFAIGKRLAREWVLHQMRDAYGVGYLRGLLLAQGVTMRPERMLEAVDLMTMQDFLRGLDAFGEANAATVVGNGELGTRISDLGTRNSDLGFRNSDLGTWISDFGTQISELNTYAQHLAPSTSNSAFVNRQSSIVNAQDPSAVPILELHDPLADVATIACAIKMPKLDSRGAAAAEMLAKALEGNTSLYSRLEMRRICVPGGEPKVRVMPDHLSIQLSVLPADVETGMRMLAAILMNSRLDQEAAAKVVQDESLRALPGWLSILDGQLRNYGIVKPQDLSDLYRLLMRPERVSVAVGGKFQSGAPERAWMQAIQTWQPARERNLVVGWEGKLRRARGPRYGALYGPEWKADAGFPQRFLALVALGSGKGSSLFRIVREEMGFSYIQHAVLWPSPDGFRPYLVIGMRPMSEIQEYSESLERIRQILLRDVENWTEEDLERALGYGAALITRGGAESPLFFSYGAPLQSDVKGRTMMAAYWQMKTGSPWNAQALAESITNVSLEELKSEAAGLLEACSLTVSG